MNPLYSPGTTDKQDFLTLVLDTVRELFAFKTDGRTVFAPEDIAVATLFMCTFNTSAETAQLVEGLPSADRILDRLNEEKSLVLGEKINQLLKKRLNEVRFPIRGKITVAGDITEYPFHGNPEKPHAMGGKRKAGTNYFLKYLTFSLVIKGHRFPVGFYPLTKERLQWVPDIVEQELAWLKERVSCDRVLLDRGFNGFTVYNGIEQQGGKFVMPLKRNEKLLKVLDDHEPFITKRERKKGFVLEGYHPPEWTGRYRVLVVPLKQRGKKKQCWAFFLTNLPIDPQTAVFIYKQRWGIETAYSQVHALEAATKSRKHAVRVFLTGLAFLLFSCWVFLNWQLACQSPTQRNRYRTGRPTVNRKRFTIAIPIQQFRLSLFLSLLVSITEKNGRQAVKQRMKNSKK